MQSYEMIQKIRANDPSLGSEFIVRNTLLTYDKIFPNICLALKENEIIIKLDMNRNKINDIDCYELISCLEKNKFLTELNLSGTYIGDKLIKSLSKGLTKNHTLEHLNLSDNPISNEGIKALGIALAHNRTLKTIDLNYIVKLNIESIKYLCRALECNHTLTEIMLDSRRFGDKTDIVRLKWLTEQNNKICLEKNPIARNNLVAEKTNTIVVPTLLQIGLFKVKQQKEIFNKEEHKLLLEEITEKVEKNSSHYL